MDVIIQPRTQDSDSIIAKEYAVLLTDTELTSSLAMLCEMWCSHFWRDFCWPEGFFINTSETCDLGWCCSYASKAWILEQSLWVRTKCLYYNKLRCLWLAVTVFICSCGRNKTAYCVQDHKTDILHFWNSKIKVLSLSFFFFLMDTFGHKQLFLNFKFKF